VAGLLGAVVLILALVFGSRPDDDDVSAVGEPPAASAPDDAGKRRPIDSGLRMLDANKASVTGTIRDADGTPIPGATVCAEASQSELLGAGDRLPKCSKSERDGHYRLDGLWPVSTSIHAGAPQFIPARWSERGAGRPRSELRLHAGEERREIDITLVRGGVPVRGVVKDIGGGVVEDALVTSGAASGVFPDVALTVARTDAEGRFELWAKPGALSLLASAEGYAPARTSAGAPTELATIFMTPESVITGTVVHVETNTPVAGVTVRASGNGYGETISDADGFFRIASLTPGRYDLEAQADELYGESAERIHLGLAESAEGVVVEVHPAFVVAGKVVIVETQAPCSEGRVTLERDGQRFTGPLDEQGETLVRAVLPGEYKVQVYCTDQVSEPEYEPIVVADQSHVGLEWKVHTGLSIRGVVVDSNAAPVVGVRIYASPKMGASADPRSQQTSGMSPMTQSDGSFELGGLLPGSYELNTWSDKHPQLAQPELVTLGEAGLDGVRLVLPATGRLVGIVHDERGGVVSGVTVQASSLARTGMMPSSARTGDDGRFELAQLETGSYRVLAQVNWSNSMRAPGTGDDDIQGELVEIVANGETQVELIVESRTLGIRGRVVDSTGAPVSDAFVDTARMSDSATVATATGAQAVRWGWDRKPVLTDHDGNFEIGELSEGEYVARAYRPGGGEGLLEHVAAGSTGIVLTIVDTGLLAGKVVFVGGGSPDQFEIGVADRAQGLRFGDDFFRTDGSFVIRELPPGNYEVTATSSEGSAKTTVVLAAGQSIEDLSIELINKITVEGRLVDADTRAPVPGMEVRISASGNFAFNRGPGTQDHVSDADGRFRVDDVVVGKVRVMILPRGSDSIYAGSNRDLVVGSEPAVQDIGELELLPRRTKTDEKAGDLGYKLTRPDPDIEPEDRQLEVAVIRPGGPAENTGLAVGDRIVEVDGRAVSGLDSHRYQTLTRAPPGTSIVLGIEGGKQVTIVLGQPVE
jgi:protocatechuate 3,4-dioxygenase beta subunit